MKKILILVALTFISLTQNASAVTVPSNYSQYDKDGAVTTYKHNNEGIYAIVVDMTNADVTFGGNLGFAGNDEYIKGGIVDHWNQNSDAVAVLNGQFYDVLGGNWKYYTSASARLVYPVKSLYTPISKKIYDDNFALRSLLINSSGKVFFREGFSQTFYNSNSIKEYLVGLYPAPVKSPNDIIGRNYIGGIPKGNCNPSNSSCEYETLIFFIATSSHYNMLHQMSLWSVPAKSRIMMDGSGSAQLYLNAGSKTKIFKGDRRKFPNSLVIRNK